MIRTFEQCVRATLRNPGATLTVERVLATAMVLTTTTITIAIHQLKHRPAQVIASGGGVRNGLLRKSLQAMLAREKIEMLTADELGVKEAAKEAMAFALLGAATLDGEPSNVPSATGAKRGAILGSITPGPGA
jgi:anhydro-N-acetylmuramic acid kinase